MPVGLLMPLPVITPLLFKEACSYFGRFLGGPNDIMFQQGLAQRLAYGKGSVNDKDGRDDGFPERETWVTGNLLEIGGPAR